MEPRIRDISGRCVERTILGGLIRSAHQFARGNEKGLISSAVVVHGIFGPSRQQRSILLTVLPVRSDSARPVYMIDTMTLITEIISEGIL
jgi:hypothetical protein